jgi:hypothetical protein
MALINCPGCQIKFEPGDVIVKEFEQNARQKMNEEWQKRKAILDKQQQEFAAQQLELQKQREQQEQILSKKLEEEKQKLSATLQQELRKQICVDYDTQLQHLQQANKENEERLQQARQKELDFLRMEKELKNQAAELELTIEKKLSAEREAMRLQLQQSEAEKAQMKEIEFQLRLKEKDMQLEEQKKLVDEMKRRSEQGSMQLQGEAQELLLEEILQQAFPVDIIEEVGKGIRGADCIQIVRNAAGQQCGSIIYESKRTQFFGLDWIDKLKADMVTTGAEIAVLVTQALPKEVQRFGEKQGVYICTFAEVKSMSGILRQAIIKLHEARKSQENKGDKMVMLYDYLTGVEFGGQWGALREGFKNLRNVLQKEREDFERNWKKKEKMLDAIIQNSLQITGSLEGIAGLNAVSMNLQADATGNLIEVYGTE